jgi:4-hydroxy-3-methylbut-2-enyl diphosphate reductase
VEVSEKSGTAAYLVDDAKAIQGEWLQNVQSVGITAGASSPELLVEQVVNHLGKFGFTEILPLETVHEDVHFALPPELDKSQRLGSNDEKGQSKKAPVLHSEA